MLLFAVSKVPQLSIVQRNTILYIYNRMNCKITAMNQIKSIRGFENITESMIGQWVVLRTSNNPGRPVCEEFEEEVMIECERTYDNDNDNKVKRGFTANNNYTYDQIRACAAKVMDRYYLDTRSSIYTKKWELNKRTNRLRFTNKWILGVLRRHSMRKVLQCSHDSQHDVSVSLSSLNSTSTPVSDSVVDTPVAEFRDGISNAFLNEEFDDIDGLDIFDSDQVSQVRRISFEMIPTLDII